MRRLVFALLFVGLIVQSLAFPVTAASNPAILNVSSGVTVESGSEVGTATEVLFQSTTSHSDTGGREAYLVRGVLVVVATIVIVEAALGYYTGTVLELTAKRAVLFVASIWVSLYAVQAYDVMLTSYSGELWPPRDFAVGMLATIVILLATFAAYSYRR